MASNRARIAAMSGGVPPEVVRGDVAISERLEAEQRLERGQHGRVIVGRVTVRAGINGEMSTAGYAHAERL